MIVLLDMDGVMCNFERGFWDMWLYLYGNEPDCPTPESIGPRNTFYVDDQLPDGWKSRGDRMIHGQGFFESLPEIEGAVESAKLIMEKGHDLFFCTKPVHTKWCLIEKHNWISSKFAPDMTRRLMIVKDKTLIRADVLVDDHPNPTEKGLMFPTWEHVVYDQPYNQGHSGRRITWKEFLDEPEILLGM